MSLLEKIKSLSLQYRQEVVTFRRHLHAHPELSYQEFNTVKYVDEQLKSLGISTTSVATTGLVAEIKGKNPEKKTVALRADMDALPILEANNVPYKSTNEGVMHACGHDVHTSSLLGTAKILNEVRDQFEGTIRFLFQPGEEKNPGGASYMIKDGALKNPQPASIIGQHVFPLLPAGKIGLKEGMYMASADEIYLKVVGKGGHGAAPDLAIDPIVIASHIIIALQQIISRNASPKQPTVLTFGNIIGKGATNIIPDEVNIAGTFRAMNEVWRESGLQKIRKMAENIAEGNWQIVGDVMMNPSIDVHHTPASPAVESGKKSKKSKVTPTVAEVPKAVTFVAGKGILLNMNDDVKKDHIVTAFEHGDIEIEFEVMLPKGSNSGIYLQGRYEVQLLDSWGVKQAKYSDIGGIYRNWETEPSKIYMGKAPLSNPSKAPGLWQKMKISFQAPRFDASGKKIANAKFVYVDLNGVRIHNHVEVPLPTGGPIENNEKATGPIMIQGDHGPVALRNIRYKLMDESKVSISETTYKVYSGSFIEVATFASLKPVKSGTSAELTSEVIDEENNYGVVYSGNITIPKEDQYEFLLTVTGGTVMKINGQTVIDLQRGDDWREHKASLKLTAGTYPYEIANFKTASWMPPRLRLAVQASSTYPKELQAFNSYPPDDNPTSPILIDAGSTPRLLRAFVDFKGDRGQRLTHTIGVGDPSGTHYVYDLESGNLACVWRGAFVDATPMWHDRGDGSFKPRGAVQFLCKNQPLAFLADTKQEFPVISKDEEFTPKGYSLEEATGRPVFKYLYKGIAVEDKVFPDDEARSITHEVSLKGDASRSGLYYKLADGRNITSLADGSFVVDRMYYIKVSGQAAQPAIREINGRQELIIPVNNSIRYTIIW